MKRTQIRTITWFFGLFLLLVSTVYAQGGESIRILDTPSQESENRLDLNVFFTVRDSAGFPIPNPAINRATIQLLGTDSEPVEVDVDKPETPIHIVLLIDSSGSMQRLMPDVRAAAQKAIDQAPRNAFFSVIQFDEETTVIQDFTDNHERVKASINNVTASQNGTCLYDATFEAIGRLEDRITNRVEQRAIILFTDGRDQLRVNDPAPCSTQTLNTVLQAALPSDRSRPSTPIHTIGLYDGADTSNINEADLAKLAEDTGAFSAFGSLDILDRLFEIIMQGLNSQLVAIARDFPAPEGTNRAILSIEQRRDGLTLAQQFEFTTRFDHQEDTTFVNARFNSSQTNEAGDTLLLRLGLANVDKISQLVVRVEDTETRQDAMDPFQIPPANPMTLEIPIADLEAEREYLVQIFALDENNIRLPINEDGDEILLERTFVKEAEEVTPFEAEITSVTPDYENKILTFTMNISHPDLVFAYAGYFRNAGTDSRLEEVIPEVGFTSTNKSTGEVSWDLPSEINASTLDGEETEYTVVLTLKYFDPENRNEEKSFEIVKDFTPQLQPQLGFFARIIAALRANTTILYGIIGVLLFMVFLVLRRNKRAKKKEVPVARPPVENKTMLFSDPMFRDLHRREDEEGFVDTVAPVTPKKATAVPSTRESNSAYKAKIAVLRMPKEQVIESRVFNMFPLTVGREADVVVREDPYISRKHVEIGVDNGSFYARDLGSKGGVRINGAKIAVGDKVDLGRKTRLQLSSKTTIEVTIAQ